MELGELFGDALIPYLALIYWTGILLDQNTTMWKGGKVLGMNSHLGIKGIYKNKNVCVAHISSP